MAKRGNDLTLAPSPNPEWDVWGAACGFTSWEKAAEALGMSNTGLGLARNKPTIRKPLRLAMDAVLAHHEGASAAVRTCKQLGYTFHGAALWKLPLGRPPRFADHIHGNNVEVSP